MTTKPTLDQFLASDHSLVICHADEIVFTSSDSDLRGLVAYLDNHQPTDNPITIYDRCVGRAAALLMLLIKPARVYTGAISEAGRDVLNTRRIPYDAREEVKYLMDHASEGMCHWEKLSFGKTPEELLDALHREYRT